MKLLSTSAFVAARWASSSRSRTTTPSLGPQSCLVYREDELPRDHPAMEAFTEPGVDGMRGSGMGSMAQPTSMALRSWGGPFLRAMLENWWRTWRSRRTTGDPILDDLACAADHNAGIRPGGRMAQWLAGYQRDASDLTPDEVRKWLGVRRHESAVHKKNRIPARFTGGGVSRHPPWQARMYGAPDVPRKWRSPSGT